MPVTTYRDTRALDPTPRTFTDVVIKGIAEGGGLYVPERLPQLDLETVLDLATLPYHRRAFEVFRRFGLDVPETRQQELLAEAYGANFDHPAVAPVVAVGDAAPGMHVLELWHGPTSAFKDMALQCMPLFFSEAVAMRRAAGADVPDFLVLVATSGDTGKAALEGFADRESTRIAVLFPARGVSEVQRRQMVTQRGENPARSRLAARSSSYSTLMSAAIFSAGAVGDELIDGDTPWMTARARALSCAATPAGAG